MSEAASRAWQVLSTAAQTGEPTGPYPVHTGGSSPRLTVVDPLGEAVDMWSPGRHRVVEKRPPMDRREHLGEQRLSSGGPARILSGNFQPSSCMRLCMITGRGGRARISQGSERAADRIGSE